MNRNQIIIIALLLLFSSLSFAAVELEIEEDHDDVMHAVEQGLIQPYSSLQETVARQLHGRIIKVELEEDDGIWVYELKLLAPDNRIIRVEYEAKSLSMIEIKGRGLENIIKVEQ